MYLSRYKTQKISLQPVWPDGGIKSSPIFTQRWPKSCHDKFDRNFVTFCKRALKATKYLGNFCKQICHLDHLKIALSGHTVYNLKEQKEWFDDD